MVDIFGRFPDMDMMDGDTCGEMSTIYKKKESVK